MWFKNLIFIFVLSSCANFSFSSKKGQYRPEVLRKFEIASSDLKNGKGARATLQLNSLQDGELKGSEKSAKYNLLGIISFNQNDWSKAGDYFNTAIMSAGEDSELLAKINLNLASVKYKQNDFSSSMLYLEKVNRDELPEDEKEKAHLLQFLLSQQLDRPFLVSESGIFLLKKIGRKELIVESDYFQILWKNFEKLNNTQKFNLLSDNLNESPVLISILAEKELSRKARSGDKEGFDDLVSWAESELSQFDDIKKLVSRYKKSVQRNDSISDFTIGVVLPLSGEKANFGRKALMGIEMAINRYELQTGRKIQLHIRDDQDQVAIGELVVEELVEQKKVAFVIGGLFSNTAKVEFLQSKKHDVLFISLSQIILPYEFKTNLLFEVPGSIESQVETIFSDKSLEKLGKKVALLYPDSELGTSYLDAIWLIKEEGRIKLTSIAKFKKDSEDQREPVMFMLGLKNQKERQQEYNLWMELSELEGQRAVRKIQSLPPVIDFEWVFIVANPQETQKLIPTFKYFDAMDLSYVGGPSWQSKGLVRNQPDLGKMFFAGILEDGSQKFSDEFIALYQTEPGIVGYLSFEAFMLGSKFLEKSSDRKDILEKIQSTGIIELDGSKWENKKGLWLREMGLLQIAKGNIMKTQ